MKVTTTTLTTDTIHSEDGKKRYLLHKEWDTEKPQLAILMIAPGEADNVALDKTTMQVLNNSVRLGFGGVYIMNLFSLINDFDLAYAESTDEENMEVIRMILEKVDTVIYAPGVGKMKNTVFLERQRQVAKILHPHEEKLQCLCNADGKSRLQHPLSPAIRVWYLSKVTIKEILAEEQQNKADKKNTPPKKSNRTKKES